MKFMTLWQTCFTLKQEIDGAAGVAESASKKAHVTSWLTQFA